MSDHAEIVQELDALVGEQVEVFLGGHAEGAAVQVPAAGLLGELRYVEPKFLEKHVSAAGAELFYVVSGQELGDYPFVCVSSHVTRDRDFDGIAWWQGGTLVTLTKREVS